MVPLAADELQNADRVPGNATTRRPGLTAGGSKSRAATVSVEAKLTALIVPASCEPAGAHEFMAVSWRGWQPWIIALVISGARKLGREMRVKYERLKPTSADARALRSALAIVASAEVRANQRRDRQHQERDRHPRSLDWPDGIPRSQRRAA